MTSTKFNKRGELEASKSLETRKDIIISNADKERVVVIMYPVKYIPEAKLSTNRHQ